MSHEQCKQVTKDIAVHAGSSWGVAHFHHASIKNSDGTPARCRVNGKCKTWKTRPNEFRLPVKHGLKECFYITEDNANEWYVGEYCED